MINLIQGDCLEEMKKLADDGVKVDMVLTDPPYGTIACKWDTVIPFDEMWDCLNQITKERTPILLFGVNPFLAELIHSNLKNFKYNFIWDKHSNSSPFLAKVQPLRVHEEIAVFYNKAPYYNPQRVPRKWGDRSRLSENDKKWKETYSKTLDMVYLTNHYYEDDGTRYPQTIISHISSQIAEANRVNRLHPTQKPVALLKWLIKNFTKENDTVLDFTMGSGSTGVACLETNRNFIGIELDEKYYNIAKERCSSYQTKLQGV